MQFDLLRHYRTKSCDGLHDRAELLEMARVELRNIVKYYDDTKVIHGNNLDIPDGELIALVGPSGCGKSTLLRMIAGLEEVSSGEILIDGIVVNELAPKDRDVAMIFQDYALYPHFTVYQNLAFCLKMRKVPADQISQQVKAAADILNISDLLDRKPRQLSGGQRQRVAMGRAIVRNPNVFLFDEPLSNLDAQLRTQMRVEIKKLHQALAATIIYVTHDQIEAMTLADRIVILRDGRIIQTDTPYEVYNHPNSMFVAGFIGAPTMNFLPCTLVEEHGRLMVRVSDQIEVSVPTEKARRYEGVVGHELILGLRPESFSLAGNSEIVNENQTYLATISMVEPLGSDTLFSFEIESAQVIARLPPLANKKPGDVLELSINVANMHLFDPVTELAI